MKLTSEQVELVEENEKLIWWYIGKYRLSHDFYGLLAESLIKSVQGFNPKLGTLSTYFHIIARRDVNAEFNRLKNMREKEIAYNEFLNYDEEYADNSGELSEDFFYGFNERQTEIVELLNQGYYNYEIAEKLGLAPSTITHEISLIRDIITERGDFDEY